MSINHGYSSCIICLLATTMASIVAPRAAGAPSITTAARMRGIRAGSPAYDKLNELLDERPSEEFFEKTLRAVKAMFNFCRFPTPLTQKHPRLTSREATAR